MIPEYLRNILNHRIHRMVQHPKMHLEQDFENLCFEHYFQTRLEALFLSLFSDMCYLQLLLLLLEYLDILDSQASAR
jgi:hypothetical protein